MLSKLKYDLPAFRGDLFGGVTAAVVGLPVALGFGVASGLGPLAGLYGAIAAGFFAAVFGGTRSQITGPTGPMSVAVAVIVTSYVDNPAEDLPKVFTIIIMAGIIQILLGAMRIGRFVAFTPYSVISGFMSGIGIIIILVQTLPFLGFPVATGGPLAAVRAWPDVFGDVNFGALIVAAVTLIVGVAWPSQFRKYLPPALATLVAGTLIGVLWLTDVPVIGDVPTGLPTFEMPDLSGSLLVGAVQPAVTIALLGAIDSLLTSLIADSITRTRHNANRELVGQGIGTVLTGFIQGLPGAGATMGTVVNIRAGGRTPVSGVVRAGILLALVLGLGQYVESIPHAVLAGILMKVGWDIIDWRFIMRIHRVQPEHLLVMLITLGLTVFLDLVTAVAIGLIAAGMASSRQFERLELDAVVSIPLLDRSFLGGGGSEEDAEEMDAFSARVGLVALRGSFTVASSNKLINTIGADIQDHEVVILDFSDTVYMDDSAALVVEQLIDTAKDQDTECIVMGLGGMPAVTLKALDALKNVPEERIVTTRDEARETAREILNDKNSPED